MSTTTTKKAATRPTQPQDHQPKQDDATEEDVRVVTVLDREWTVPTAALDDFELMGDIAEVQNGGQGVIRMPSLLRRLLGDAQYADAMDACRDTETRRVTVEAGVSFVMSLMEALNPNS